MFRPADTHSDSTLAADAGTKSRLSTASGTSGGASAALAVVFVVLGLAATAGVWRLVAGAGEARGEYFGPVQPPAADVLRFPNGAEPETLDPGLVSGQTAGRIAIALFEGLLVPHPQSLEPIPGVARRWELAADGVTWTFHLRPDAVWTNGDPVTARDFEWSWLRVLHPDTPARNASLFYVIRAARAYKQREIADPGRVGIRAVDDTTFQVVLERPTPYFLPLVTYYPFLPVHRATLEKWRDRWTLPGNIVTNGPFRLVEHRQNDRIVMQKFRDYWDARHVRLDRIIAYSIDDLTTMLHMYRAGMTDWNPSGYLPAQYIPYVRRYRDYRSGPSLATYFYSVAVGRSAVADKRVRQALALAIDRQALVRYVLHASVQPWGNIVAAGFERYSYPPGVGFDPERARVLLAAAGYPGGRGFPSLEILFNTSEDHRKIAEAIQAMWNQHLGIDVKLTNQEWASYLRATTELQYDVARRSWIGDYLDPDTFLGVLRAGDGNNRTGWGSARYDALLDAAAATRDPDLRLRTLAAAESLALDEMPFIPIYSYSTREFVAPYVRGLYPTALDTHPLKFVWIDRSGGEPLAAAAGERP